jgi:hypothetical protein
MRWRGVPLKHGKGRARQVVEQRAARTRASCRWWLAGRQACEHEGETEREGEQGREQQLGVLMKSAGKGNSAAQCSG